MTIETMLSSLSTSEKLDAMDFLWRDLSREPGEFQSPPWHGEVLANRLANPSDGPSLTLDAAMQNVKERLDARGNPD